HQEAHIIKVKYGMNPSKKQVEIKQALQPLLEKTVREIKRMLRYYEERSSNNRRIEQIITLGGGSNVPGLTEYLIDALRLPVRPCDPWNSINFRHLGAPTAIEKPVYITVAGLALINPGEVFA